MGFLMWNEKWTILGKKLKSGKKEYLVQPERYCVYSFFLRFKFILVDEESRNKRYSISTDEMEYICHLLTLDVLTPKQKALFDVAEKIYKEKSKQFQPKICHSYSIGEGVLKCKTLEYLRYDMECHHNAISHLAFNMAKMAGGLTIFATFISMLNISVCNTLSLTLHCP